MLCCADERTDAYVRAIHRAGQDQLMWEWFQGIKDAIFNGKVERQVVGVSFGTLNQWHLWSRAKVFIRIESAEEHRIGRRTTSRVGVPNSKRIAYYC